MPGVSQFSKRIMHKTLRYFPGAKYTKRDKESCGVGKGTFFVTPDSGASNGIGTQVVQMVLLPGNNPRN